VLPSWLYGGDPDSQRSLTPPTGPTADQAGGLEARAGRKLLVAAGITPQQRGAAGLGLCPGPWRTSEALRSGAWQAWQAWQLGHLCPSCLPIDPALGVTTDGPESRVQSPECRPVGRATGHRPRRGHSQASMQACKQAGKQAGGATKAWGRQGCWRAWVTLGDDAATRANRVTLAPYQGASKPRRWYLTASWQTPDVSRQD
jgi:hypothetical protein